MNSDRYIASIKRLHLAVLLLVFAVVYIYFQEYNRIQDVNRSQILQTLLSAQEVVGQLPSATPIVEKDLSKISATANFNDSYVKLRENIKKMIAENPELANNPGVVNSTKPMAGYLDVPLTDSIIPGASIVTIEPTRFSPRSDCIALALPGSGAHTLTVPLLGGELFNQALPLSQIRLLNLSYRCNLPVSVHSFLLIQAPISGEWILGVPVKLFSATFWPNVKISNLQYSPIKIDQSQFFESYSDAVITFITLDDAYIGIPKIILEAEIFSEAERVTGKLHSPNDLEGAIDDISKNSDSYTTVGGINTTGLFLVQIAPFILTGILFLMFIQLRRLDAYRHITSEPWLYKDIRGSVEIVLAVFTALVPVIAVVGLFFCVCRHTIFGFSHAVFYQHLPMACPMGHSSTSFFRTNMDHKRSSRITANSAGGYSGSIS